MRKGGSWVLSVEQEDLLAAVSGAAQGCELFTEDDRLGAVSGAAGGYERGRERKKEVARFPGTAGGSASALESYPISRAVYVFIPKMISSTS